MSLPPPSNLELAILQLIDDLVLVGRPRELNPYATVKEYLCTLLEPFQFCEDKFASFLEEKRRAVAGTVAFDQVPAVLVAAELAGRDADFQAQIGLAAGADVESEVNQAFKKLRSAGLIKFDQYMRSLQDAAYQREDGAIVLLTHNPDHKRIATGNIVGGKIQFHDDYEMTGRIPEQCNGPVLDIRVVDRLPTEDPKFGSKAKHHVQTHLASWSEGFNNLGIKPIDLYALSGLPLWEDSSPSEDSSWATQGATPLKSKASADSAKCGPMGRLLFSSAFLVTEQMPCYLVTPEGREVMQIQKSPGQQRMVASGSKHSSDKQQWETATKATEMANRLTGIGRDWSSYWRGFCRKFQVLMRPGRKKDGSPTAYRPQIEVGSLVRTIKANGEEVERATPEAQKWSNTIHERVRREHGIDEDLRTTLNEPD